MKAIIWFWRVVLAVYFVTVLMPVMVVVNWRQLFDERADYGSEFDNMPKPIDALGLWLGRRAFPRDYL